MKKEFKHVELALGKMDSNINAKCDCPAGKSGYCNHVMALLFELADYSLNGLSTVPDEISCTSKSRQWGIPSELQTFKDPIMTSPVRSNNNKGISCTLYDPRIKGNEKKSMESFKLKLEKKDKRIGFANCLDLTVEQTTKNKYGDFLVGSTLSHQLAPVEQNVLVITNINTISNNSTNNFTQSVNDINLPLSMLSEDFIPTDWGKLTYREMMFLETLRVDDLEQAAQIELSTVNQAGCPKWFQKRKHRITSSKAHDIYVRKKNFETLANRLLNPKSDNELPNIVKDAMKHGKIYEPIARKLYTDYLKYTMRHNVKVRETGLVVQPYLFWLAASPDGLVQDESDDRKFGLIEIKCPKTKKNLTPQELCKDSKFYVEMDNDKPRLKRDHSNGYYTQIQMAMGLTGATFCDFVVYTFKGLIVVRTDFDETYFKTLLEKLNNFYKHYMLPNLS